MDRVVGENRSHHIEGASTTAASTGSLIAGSPLVPTTLPEILSSSKSH